MADLAVAAVAQQHLRVIAQPAAHHAPCMCMHACVHAHMRTCWWVAERGCRVAGLWANNGGVRACVRACVRMRAHVCTHTGMHVYVAGVRANLNKLGIFGKGNFWDRLTRFVWGLSEKFPRSPKYSQVELFRPREFLGRVRRLESQTQKRPSITATNPDEASPKIPTVGFVRLDGHFGGHPRNS